MDTWLPIVGVDSELGLQEAAAAEGIRLPSAIRSPSGAVVESIGGHPWRVYRWLHSGPPLAAPVSAEHTYQVGGILATIFGLGLPVDRISPWSGTRLSDVTWTQLASTAQAEGVAWAHRLVAAVPILEGLDSMCGDSPVPEPVLCFVPGPGNVRLGEYGAMIVDGWEHAHGLPPDWGLADALMHWTIDPNGSVNTTGARAMIDGYRDKAGSVPRLECASFEGAINGLANYVSGQIGEALTARTDEDRHHFNRSVTHLLSHLPTRESLERLVEVSHPRE